ncbi:DUF4430 domain-containing protein [Adlercreutzia sp. ZJ141]|uniref:DUF4430 domain-containing protein n=1 Tax=Adlercreutzia sp. ZJ141 TaxID=2709406 RepID=UPI0013EB0ECD|nr:DUF4430 domain-containing protein [Adlercreutzia sp. ZJ141]
MSIGSVCVHSNERSTHPCTVFRKAIALFMALVLAVSMTPSTAWAESTDEEFARSATDDVAATASVMALPTAQNADEAGGSSSNAPAADDESVSREGAAASESSQDGGAQNGDDVASGFGDTQNTQDSEQASVDGSTPVATNDNDVSTDMTQLSVGATDEVAEREAQVAARARVAATLTDARGVSVGTNPNPQTFSNATGFIQQETTLYAHAWKSRSVKINDDGSWTYEWYVGADKNAADLSTYVKIEGQTGSSITITNTMREQYAGKYIRVKITSDEATFVGPNARVSGSLSAIGGIKAPVPPKTALDGKSYILLQDSADVVSSFATVEAASVYVGATLFANAWDSEASPSARISAQSGWSYQWLAGDSRDAADADYQPIEGQTGASLTITEEIARQLSGKYVRVKVTGDGQTLYGPSSIWDYPASSSYDTPGPIVAAGQVMLNHVVLAYNGEEFGSDYESVPTGNVGDKLQAKAYHSDDPYTLFGADNVDFSWQIADSATVSDSDFREIATGERFTVTDACEGKYLRVVATAKNGVPGCNVHATEAGRILPRGVHELSSVKLLNASRAALDTGTVLEAMAYEGDYWSEEPVREGVTYTWRWADEDPTSASFDAVMGWHNVPDVTGDSFTVPDDFVGRWVSVAACAGDNQVESDDWSAVHIKPAGSAELYYAALNKVSGDDAFVYKAGEIIGITANETSSAGTKGQQLANDRLTFTWKISDERNGDYVELADENVHQPQFVIPESYVGKYLRCEVSAGFNVEVATMRYAIEPPAQDIPSYEISSVDMECSGNVAQVGATVTPVVKQMVSNEWGSYEEGLPTDAVVRYTWYASDDAEGSNAQVIPVTDAKTGALKLVGAHEGAYLYVVANAGANSMRSEVFRVEPAEAQVVTVSVKVTGVTEHAVGEAFQAEPWISLTEYTWFSSATERKTAWDVFAELLDKAGYSYNTTGACPYSITTPDKRPLAQKPGAAWSYWSFYVNGSYATSMPNGYALRDGDVIELVYIDATGEQTFPDITPNPGAAVPDGKADWGGYGNAENGSATEAATPTQKAEAAWTYDYSEEAAFASWSEPVVVNGRVYLASETELRAVDASTGKVLARAPLAASVGYGSRPVYVDGLIVVALNSGRLQALTADALETVWLTDPLPDGALGSGQSWQQALSTISVHNGYLYTGTAVADYSTSYGGYFLCVNAKTGAIKWMTRNDTAGYYWAGAAFVGDYAVFAGDDGVVCSVPVSSADGAALGSLNLSASVRSTIISDGAFVYVVTTDGVLHKVSVGSDGVLSEVASVQFAAFSTSTPTIVDGKAYVGGSLSTYKGVLAVIDVAAMTLVSQVTKADGTDLIAEVKSRPLVSVQQGSTYVYFTCNGAVGEWPAYTSGGGVLVYRAGDTEAAVLYDPPAGLANYCMGSVAAGSDGTLYYVNDSGLFALKASSGGSGGEIVEPSDGTLDGTPGDVGGDSNDNAAPFSGGHVPALRAPLTPDQAAALKDAEGDAGVEAADEAGKDAASEHARSGTAAKEKSADAAVGASVLNGGNETGVTREFNPVALAGLLAGLAGLGGALVFLLGRCRKDDEGENQEGTRA